MFVDSMNGKELFNEYNADLPELDKLALEFSESSIVSKYFDKRRKDPIVIVSKQFSTSKNNKYIGLLIYENIGSKRKNNWSWTSCHIGLMNTNKGECAIAFFKKSKQALKFTPHFFKRYKERLMEICDWKTKNLLLSAKTPIDIITIYSRRNPFIVWIETKSVFYDKVHIFSPVNDGIALVQWDKNNKMLQANTFVTIDMLDEKQKKMIDSAKAYMSMTDKQKKEIEYPDFILET